MSSNLLQEVIWAAAAAPGYSLASMLSNPGIKYRSLVALSARRTCSPTCGGLQSIAFFCILAQNILEVAAGGGEL